jgi:uncharacterized repeat protein (TIGR01451 family)
MISWIRRFAARIAKPVPGRCLAVRRAATARLWLEQLEGRVMPTVVTLTPRADDTLYQDPAGQLSNGAGQHFYVGDTFQAANRIRRGIIAFNLSGIPAGSTINSATLTLHMSLTRAGAQDVALHRALKNWGEGSSNAAGGTPGAGEGDGTQATTGDVTWVYTFFSSQRWTNPGGDFAAASATTSVNGVGSYQWTGVGVVANVQQWVNNPAMNFGWILTGEETTGGNAKQFDSRENSNPANRPTLTIDYTPGSPTPAADLTIRKGHSGIFAAGLTGAYTITVTNSGAASTTAAVTVNDILPAGLTYTGPTSVNGWTITVNQQTVNATRSDTLAAHASYQPLTLAVKIAGNAPARITNTATVAGGGEVNTSNDAASDVTAVLPTQQMLLLRRRGA